MHKSRLLVLFAAVGFPADASAQPTAPVQVMFLGVYHMGNPGLDVNNAKADDPLSAKRQRELEILAAELAKFRPTRVMVERVGLGNDLTPKSWGEFTPAKLAAERDEGVQIAYRLAYKLKIPVHGIDERDRPGEPSYFPYDDLKAFAASHGEAAQLDALNAPFQAYNRKFEEAEKSKSVAALLAMFNDPGAGPRDMAYQYGLLRFADGPRTPGADLNARWYL